MRYWPVPSVSAVRTFSVSDWARCFNGHAGQHGSRGIAHDACDGRLRKRGHAVR